jgi:von Willebrand factor type A domain
MRMRAIVCLLLLGASGLRAATPQSDTRDGMSVVRVTSAEVHVTLTAVDDKTRNHATLSPADLIVVRDGESVEKISALEDYHQAPLSLVVLTDVSESMLPGVSLERTATQHLQSKSNANDHLTLLDFGFELTARTPQNGPDLTSLYDSLIRTIAAFPSNSAGRRAILVLTDGDDNYSYHSLKDVISAAQRSDTAIYAITAHPSRKQIYRPDVLHKICSETGGEYFDVRNADGVTNAIDEIADELRNGYDLVFRPDSTSAGLHQLTVRSEKSGVRIRHRSAFFQPLTKPDTDIAAQ